MPVRIYTRRQVKMKKIFNVMILVGLAIALIATVANLFFGLSIYISLPITIAGGLVEVVGFLLKNSIEKRAVVYPRPPR